MCVFSGHAKAKYNVDFERQKKSYSMEKDVWKEGKQETKWMYTSKNCSTRSEWKIIEMKREKRNENLWQKKSMQYIGFSL